MIKITQRPIYSPFDIRDGRVMVSLGPLSEKKFCTYSCPFCYVGNDFHSYVSMTPAKIANWVAALSEPYNIIYVSCDTDSFAPPRVDTALELLDLLTAFKVDLLFTTRALLSDTTIAHLGQIAGRLAVDRRMLIGCGSVLQLTVPHLEPRPIPPPDARIAQLNHFRRAGLKTILALRPFLPNVPLTDLQDIIAKAASFVDLVLGGVWYYDQQGRIRDETLGAEGANLIPNDTRRMPFDDNEAEWHVFEGTAAQAAVVAACRFYDIPMFMRSGPAVAWLRAQSSLCFK